MFRNFEFILLGLNYIRLPKSRYSTRPPPNLVPLVVVHGGAGDISNKNLNLKRAGVKLAARLGFLTLIRSNSVLDAVQDAVKYMEINPIFNSGYGSALTLTGEVEMDAAIINGADLRAGCVSLVRCVLHPVCLARAVMERTKFRYLAGEAAMELAKQERFEILHKDELITTRAREELQEYKEALRTRQNSPEGKRGKRSCDAPGTVGAVAIDSCGNVAAATSTGGLTGKPPGRIGDSPILGCGTYADNDFGCVSCTGHGESFMRYMVASRILMRVKYEGLTAQEAVESVLNAMAERFQRTGGAICIDVKGNVGVYFNTDRMSWAYQKGNTLHSGIEKDEDISEVV